MSGKQEKFITSALLVSGERSNDGCPSYYFHTSLSSLVDMWYVHRPISSKI